MRSWTWQQWLLFVLGVGVAVAVSVLFLLGLSAAISAGGSVEFSAGTVTWLSGLAAVAMYAGGLAAALAVAWLATKGVERRLAKANSSYLQFVGVSVSVLSWAMGQVLADDQLVAGVFAAIAGLVSIGAGKAIRRWPIIGLVLYAALPLGVIVVAHLTGAIDAFAWLGGLAIRDWALLAVLVGIVVLVPTTVCLVERRWKTEQWMLGDRFSAWLMRHRALAWLTRGGDESESVGG